MDVGWLGIFLTCVTTTGLLSVASIAVCNTIGMHLFSTKYYDQKSEEVGRVFTHANRDARRARFLVSRHPRNVGIFYKTIIFALLLSVPILAMYRVELMSADSKLEALSAGRDVSGDILVPWGMDAVGVELLWNFLWISSVVTFYWSVTVVLMMVEISRVSYKALTTPKLP